VTIAMNNAPDWAVGNWNMTGWDINGVNTTWVVGNGTASWCSEDAQTPSCCTQVRLF
jgi:hypothetical protein